MARLLECIGPTAYILYGLLLYVLARISATPGIEKSGIRGPKLQSVLWYASPVSLKFLCLTATQITDAGLERQTCLTGLQELFLENAQATDAGLEYLHGLIELDWLNVTGTKVTDEGVEKLQQALPNCKIQH